MSKEEQMDDVVVDVDGVDSGGRNDPAGCEGEMSFASDEKLSLFHSLI